MVSNNEYKSMIAWDKLQHLSPARSVRSKLADNKTLIDYFQPSL
jgi:hypothetical protein